MNEILKVFEIFDLMLKQNKKMDHYDRYSPETLIRGLVYFKTSV